MEIPLEKATVATLAMEFFSASSFELHESKFNKIIFRRNGFGSALKNFGVFLVGGQGLTIDTAQMQCVITTLARPHGTGLNLEVEVENIEDHYRHSTNSEWWDEQIHQAICVQFHNYVASFLK